MWLEMTIVLVANRLAEAWLDTWLDLMSFPTSRGEFLDMLLRLVEPVNQEDEVGKE